MQGIGEVAKASLEFMEVVSFEIYGRPSDAVLETMTRAGGSGVTLKTKPQPIGGYIRFKSG